MVKSKKHKIWFDIVAPEFFKNKILSKTLAESPENLINRRAEILLTDLVENSEKFFVKVVLRIINVENNTAKTKVDEVYVIKNYLENFVTAGIDKIDVVKDFNNLRFKVLIILNGQTNNSIKTNIRKTVGEFIEKECKNLTLDEIILKISSNEIENKLINEINKIYPVRFLEFRKIETL